MPAAAITPAWRIPPPRRDRSRARLGDQRRACRTATSRPARETLRQAEHHGVGPGDERASARRRARSAAFQMRAPSQCTASPCVARAPSITASSSPTRHGPPARRHVRVLERRARRSSGRWCCCDAARAVDVVGVRAMPSASGSGRSCTPRVPRRRGVLVAVHVRPLAAQHLGARAAEHAAARAGWPSCPTARRARPPCRAARRPATRAGGRSGPRRTRRRRPRRRPSRAASPAWAW